MDPEKMKAAAAGPVVEGGEVIIASKHSIS